MFSFFTGQFFMDRKCFDGINLRYYRYLLHKISVDVELKKKVRNIKKETPPY